MSSFIPSVMQRSVLVINLLVFTIASIIPLQRDGVSAWNVGPPTPFWWPSAANGSTSGQMMVFESARYCQVNNTYWPPDPESGKLEPYSRNHSYFRVRDLKTGAVVGHVQGSEGYSYGSAVVDPLMRRAWIFGSPKDICHPKPVPTLPNYIRAWWSDDLVHWHTAGNPAIGGLSVFPFNTRVTPVANFSPAPGSGLPSSTQFVLIMDKGRVAFHNATDRNMSTGWHLLDGEKDHGVGACPSVHYAEEDGFFYVISGGRIIALARTRDFKSWQHAPTFIRADASKDAVVAPFLGMQAQVDGKGGDAEAVRSLRSDLAHPSCWEFDVNDADFCCGAGAPQDKAYILFSPSSQGKPPRENCSHVTPVLASTNFNAIATANASLTALLQSRFTVH